MRDPIVTGKLIDSLRTENGGWTKCALAYLGVEWPPRRGWKLEVLNQPRRPLEADRLGLWLCGGTDEQLVRAADNFRTEERSCTGRRSRKARFMRSRVRGELRRRERIAAPRGPVNATAFPHGEARPR